MFEGMRVEVFRSTTHAFEAATYRHAPCLAQVIALGEAAPVSDALIARLWDLDVDTLTEDQAIGYAVGMERIAAAAHARRGLAVNRALTCSPDLPEMPRELHAAGQLGPALGLGTGGTDTLIADAAQLATVLPATQSMALAGDLPWRKAASIATATIAMTPEGAARVEAKVLGKAWERSPARHDAAVRRAVDAVDPQHADRTRKDRERDIRMVTHHYGAGMGELFATMPSEELDLLRLAADAYARRLKAGGDSRTLDHLRVAFLGHCARSYLTHADPAHCHTVCDPPPQTKPQTNQPPANTHQPATADVSTPPTRQGRPVVLHLTWDLTSLLGRTDHCGELRDSATLLPPSAVRDLLRGGGRVRRMVIDPDTGEALDLTPITWTLPATDGAHRQPLVLTITTTARLNDLPDDLRAALDACDPAFGAMLRELLDYPLTAADLDNQPDAETPSPALAEFTASRAAHPVNPCAGPTAAAAGDIDHHQAKSQGGKTVRTNLGPIVRRWHRIKTFTGWTVKHVKLGWEWTSPTGRKYTIEPHDYRLGP
jgi:hypothetical protein